MAQPSNFSQQYQAALARRGVSATPQAPLNISGLKAVTPGKQDPLSWFIDILSRPMRAVENVPNQVFNEMIKADAAKKAGIAYNPWEAAGNIITAPVRGLLSTNKADQPSGSELIEKGTDAFGLTYDKNYQDLPENVNPWVKGIGGFGLDVALDPLTYIPGAQLAKAGQLGLKGVKSLVGGADALVAGSNFGKVIGSTARVTNKANAVKLAEEAAAAAKAQEEIAAAAQREASRYTPSANMAQAMAAYEATRPVASKLLQDIKPSFEAPVLKGAEASKAKFSDTVAKINSTEVTAAEKEANKKFQDNWDARQRRAAKADTQMAATDAEAARLINAAVPEEALAAAPKASAAVVKAAEQVPLSVPDQMAAQAGAFGNVSKKLDEIKAVVEAKPAIPVSKNYDEWLADEIAKAKANPDYSLSILNAEGTAVGRASAADLAKAKNPKLIPEATKMLLKSTHENLFKAASGTSTKAVTYSDYVAKMLKTKKGTAEFQKLFGEKATAQLSKMTNNQLQSAVAHLGEVLRGQKNVELESALNRASGGYLSTGLGRFTDAVLTRYGIDIPGTNVRRLQAESNIGTQQGDEIAAAIIEGQDMRTAGYLVGVTEPMYKSVMSWLPKFIQDDFTNLRGYVVEKTKTLVSIKRGPGDKVVGKRHRELNTMDQWTMWERSQKRARDKIAEFNREMRASKNVKDRNKVIAGLRRAEELEDNGLKEFRIATNVLDGKSTAFYIGVGAEKVRLDAVQMYTALNMAAKKAVIRDAKGIEVAGAGNAREAMKIALLNSETSVPFTNLAEAVLELELRPNTTYEQLSAILRKEIPGATNALNGSGGFYRHFVAKPNAPLYSLGLTPNPRYKGMYYGNLDPARFEEELISVLREAAPDISQIIKNNDAMVAARRLAEGKDLSDAQLKKLVAFSNDSTAMADSVRAAANIPKDVSEAGALGRATVEAQMDATIAVDSAIRADIVAGAQDAVAIEKAARVEPDFNMSVMANDSRVREKFKEITNSRLLYDVHYADQLATATKAVRDGFDSFGNLVDPLKYAEGVYELASEHSMARVLNPMREAFDIRHGAKRVVDRYQQSTIQLMRGLQEYNMGLTGVVREFKGLVPGTETTIIEQAFRDIANNVPSAPGIAGARAALEPFVHQVFGANADSAAIQSIFIRGGGTIQDMEAYMLKDKIDFPFDLNLARDTVASGLAKSDVEAAIQQWGVVFASAEDPIQLLSKFYHAGAQMASDKVSADLFRQMSGVWSKTPKPGYVKVPDVSPLESPFIAHLPKDSFVEAAYLDEIRQIEKVATSPKTIEFLRNTYMPLLANWKYGVTVLRPGHHVRNLLSSSVMQYVAEGTRHYAKSANAAIEILMTHHAYDGVDWLETAKGIGMANMPTSGKVMFGSKWGDITNNAIYEAAQKKGLFVEYKQSQDVLDEMAGKGGFLKKASDKLLMRGTRVEKVAGAVAEYQTHFSRLAHFNQILMKEANSGKFKSWNDLVEYAAKRVRKHHPDSTMLAPTEAKLRAIIPFYTWFRLILPRIVEGIATQPGRFLVFPKASFGLATAMGVDPYSLADPFPQDQLFPSFLTDQMTGPIAEINGNYIGANPGVPYIDMLNQFIGQGPVRGTVGMISPFVRIPAELLGGTQWGTGAKIKDLSDYVDSNIPGVNYLANVTGTSITGSAVSLASGQGLDSQYAVAAKNKTPFDQAMTASNWITGMGLQNFSKPNYINYAEIEQRNAAAKDKNPRSPY